MGYNFYIGEAEPTIYLEDRYACMGVKHVELDEAPVNSSENRSNYCYPGYLVWANFCREVGLWSVFYAPECPNRHQQVRPCDHRCLVCGGGKPVYWIPPGKTSKQAREGLLSRDESGAKELIPEHLVAFKAARERWLERPESERLDWLVFWTEWALENCKYPSFATS